MAGSLRHQVSERVGHAWTSRCSWMDIKKHNARMTVHILSKLNTQAWTSSSTPRIYPREMKTSIHRWFISFMTAKC